VDNVTEPGNVENHAMLQRFVFQIYSPYRRPEILHPKTWNIPDFHHIHSAKLESSKV
jgi:hypothetical protein